MGDMKRYYEKYRSIIIDDVTEYEMRSSCRWENAGDGRQQTTLPKSQLNTLS
jgi:hypothetical protein